MKETIADRIKKTRLNQGLSQSELAKKAGYNDKTAISKFEHAGDDISMKQIKRVAKALNVSASYLMGWSTATDVHGVEVEYADPEGHVKRSFIEHAPDNLKPHAISDFEFKIITAYRSHPEVQSSILKLLDLEEPEAIREKKKRRSTTHCRNH